MKRSNAFWGVLLICAGVLFLLQNWGLVNVVGGLVWSSLFGLAGLAFLAFFATDRSRWWSLIPGMTLLGLSGLIGMGTVFPRFTEAWGGAFFLGCIGLSFWLIYLVERRNWWAVIPAGALTTLALIAALSPYSDGMEMGGVLFLGLAATFGLVYFLPTPEGPMRWAIFPAGILGAMGLLVLMAAGNVFNFVWATALIGAGLYLIVRNLRSQNLGGKEEM